MRSFLKGNVDTADGGARASGDIIIIIVEAAKGRRDARRLPGNSNEGEEETLQV